MIIAFHLIISVIITWITYFLNRHLEWGAVKASSFIALIIGGFYQLNEWYFQLNIDKDIPFIAIGSTFIGMVTSRKHFRNFNFFFAPLIFIIVYHNLSKEFNGFGGALGTAACISLVISIYLRSLSSTKKAIKPFRKIKISTLNKKRLARKNNSSKDEI